jgi:hypothetical protein
MPSEFLVRSHSSWQGEARRSGALPRTRRDAFKLRPVAVVLAMAMGVGVFGARPIAAVAVARAEVAQWVTGIRRVSDVTSYDSESPKSLGIACPSGKILGGGAIVYGSSQVALTRLQPYVPGTDPENPYGYGYRVTAAETGSSVDGNWSITAVAVCANSVEDLHIVSHGTNWSTSSVQAADAVCPDGERALGTGARIVTQRPGGEVDQGLGLQVARVDAMGGLTRAQARELPSGYDAGSYGSNWRLVAYVVCAPSPFGYQVRTGSSYLETDSSKTAGAPCGEWVSPVGRTYATQAISACAAVDNTAPGNVTLHHVYPDTLSFPTNWAFAAAYENPPTSAEWTLIVRYICLPGL